MEIVNITHQIETIEFKHYHRTTTYLIKQVIVTTTL